MKPTHTFTVAPSLPPVLEPLHDLSTNLWWAWNHQAIELFRRLDADMWESTGHNPVRLLGTIQQQRLADAAQDAGFVAHMERVMAEFQAYRASDSTWFQRTYGQPDQARDGRRPLVAYFSAEFGLTECLSIFAGGLGLLAGDHLKSASDLGVPLVGVGLLYQEGYFRQELNDAGWQQEKYTNNDFYTLPVVLERRPDGAPMTIEVSFPGRIVTAQVWRVQVGRVPLYLLDTALPSNTPADRGITQQLYGGDNEMRLQQELMLGVGGYRALAALGVRPSVFHLNEGHAGFVVLERIRAIMTEHHAPFNVAREIATASLIFTTHTPVAAGHDYFPTDMLNRYLADYPHTFGLSPEGICDLGRIHPGSGEAFGMTTLALRLAAHSNGVSRLHGKVSREMWRVLWPPVPVDEVPITHVTNGVHLRSWISREMDSLYQRYIGPDWWEMPATNSAWQRGLTRVPAEELWRTHELRRDRLVAFARASVRRNAERRGAGRAEIDAADEVLEAGTLTLGFARRFATYKRATLLLRDPDRLARLLNDHQRPVQLIFAGKAHPRDDAGKELIRQIVMLSREERFRRRLVFLEDYDTAVAREMVQGSDVWLNTPRRPEEASGTSGMKAAVNGTLNASILDGWWDEAWTDLNSAETPIGWAIGRGEGYASGEEQDQVESEALFHTLEREIVPTFYDRGSDGLPRRWIGLMKASVGTISPIFNTHRMVEEYADRFYVPMAAHAGELGEHELGRARALAAWKARVEGAWGSISVQAGPPSNADGLKVGARLAAQARVRLGELTPSDVAVELYVGSVDVHGDLTDARAISMRALNGVAGGEHVFGAESVDCVRSGLTGYTVRVRPSNPDQATNWQPPLLTWESPSEPPSSP
jgi:starch phosphorylase